MNEGGNTPHYESYLAPPSNSTHWILPSQVSGAQLEPLDNCDVPCMLQNWDENQLASCGHIPDNIILQDQYLSCLLCCPLGNLSINDAFTNYNPQHAFPGASYCTSEFANSSNYSSSIFSATAIESSSNSNHTCEICPKTVSKGHLLT